MALIAGFVECASAQRSTPNIEVVSPEDCSIIAAILNAKDSNPLSFASYGATCDWSKLNLDVRATNATSGWRAFFDHPIYAQTQQAYVTYSDVYTGEGSAFGSHEYNCKLEKVDGQWRIESCVAGLIAN
jgi:hypothetical protein